MSRIKSLRKSRTLGLSSAPHRRRYREVLRVLMKYGLDEFLVSETGKKLINIRHKSEADPKLSKLSRPVRIRLALEELNGGFVKIAQILSNRPDIIPEEYLVELEKLQDKVPPFSSDEAVQIIEQELDDKLYNLFLMFDSTPIATGSIAQIHKAVHFDGTPVVVKVRRPGVVEKFQIDLDIFTYLAYQTAKIKVLKSQFKDRNPIEELSKLIYKELELDNELINIKSFKRKMEHVDDVYVPTPLPSYSTDKVLTMEFVDGVKVTQLEGYTKFDLDPEEIANRLVDVGLIQIFENRYFHGDPHPGNILVMEDGRTCFVDFGLMGRITNRQKETIIDLISAYSRNDYRQLTRIVTKYIPKDQFIDEDKIESEISDLLDKYYDVELKEINVGEALLEIVDFVLKYKITLNFNTYLLIKAITSYEGIGKRIYPEFDLTDHSQQFMKKIVREQLNPKNIAKDLYLSGTDLVNLLRNFPTEIHELLNMIQGGRLRINVGVLGLNETVDYVFSKLNSIVNRLITTILIAATLLSSALVLNVTPSLDSRLVISVAALGFILSAILSVWIVISMFRNRK